MMNSRISKSISSAKYLNGKYYLLLFIVWPFLSFIFALTDYNNKIARKVIYIFLVYFGLTFIAVEGLDAVAYAHHLRVNATLPFTDFFKIVSGLYSTDTSVDIVEPLISFIISRFTSNQSILFATYAAIFGFFYLKSINLLHERHSEKPGLNALIFMVFFIVILPITEINGFRMWTAAWVFFYGAYHVVIQKDKKFLLLALTASFVHWSFLSINLILLLYSIAGNRNIIYIPIALVSFFLPHLLGPTFQLLSLRLGGGLQERFESYSSEDYILYRQADLEQASWFLQIGNNLVFYFLILCIIVIKLQSRDLAKGKAESNLFSFLLLILSFVNFGKDIPSFGGRFQIIFFLFGTLYVFLYMLKQPEHKINTLTWIGMFPMLLYTAVKFRQGSELINAWLLSPGLGVPLFVPEVSLAEFLFH